MKKSVFCPPKIEYLSHIIDTTGDPAKIQVMADWPSPTSLKALRGFLGITGYYRRFVGDYNRIAWPLTQQLQKDSFKWNATAQTVFQQLKKAMTEIPVLALSDFAKQFVIETDACGYGLSCPYAG